MKVIQETPEELLPIVLPVSIEERVQTNNVSQHASGYTVRELLNMTFTRGSQQVWCGSTSGPHLAHQQADLVRQQNPGDSCFRKRRGPAQGTTGNNTYRRLLSGPNCLFSYAATAASNSGRPSSCDIQPTKGRLRAIQYETRTLCCTHECNTAWSAEFMKQVFPKFDKPALPMRGVSLQSGESMQVNWTSAGV